MKRAKQIITSVQQKISYTHNDIGSLLGWNKSFFDEARGARIILYHGICLNDPMRFNNIFLPLKTFREHIHFYKNIFISFHSMIFTKSASIRIALIFASVLMTDTPIITSTFCPYWRTKKYQQLFLSPRSVKPGMIFYGTISWGSWGSTARPK